MTGEIVSGDIHSSGNRGIGDGVRGAMMFRKMGKAELDL